MGSMPAPLNSSADLRSENRLITMLLRRLALVGTGTTLVVMVSPMAA